MTSRRRAVLISAAALLGAAALVFALTRPKPPTFEDRARKAIADNIDKNFKNPPLPKEPSLSDPK